MLKSFFIGLSLWVVLVAAHAAPPPNPDPTLSEWYKGLKIPDTGSSCCDVSDCREVNTRTGKFGYEIFINDKWVIVPPNRILNNKENPTGHPIACYNQFQIEDPTIYCFIDGWRI